MMLERVDHGITLWSKRAGLLLLGWFLSSAYHGTLTSAQAVKEVPALKAEAGCEHWRAGVATKLALQTSIVDPDAIPKACAHPKILAERK